MYGYSTSVHLSRIYNTSIFFSSWGHDRKKSDSILLCYILCSQWVCVCLCVYECIQVSVLTKSSNIPHTRNENEVQWSSLIDSSGHIMSFIISLSSCTYQSRTHILFKKLTTLTLIQIICIGE